MKRRSQTGVALVVTLIMLSVITVMTVAFLALTRRERASVTQTSQYTDAKLMADAGFQRAKGNILAQILTSTNLLEPDFAVSRNYINLNGFDPNIRVYNPENVNYDYRVGGGRAFNISDELVQNIANLYYDPRVPVFVSTNEFRFYLDLNRNGRFETNGIQPDLNNQGALASTNKWNLVGDPEWIGVLEQPAFSHSRTNRFIGRYAFVIQPIGKLLDENFIHNHGKESVPNTLSGFFRNQGFGSWEINLGAFLADLNTNFWNSYFYNTNPLPGNANTGVAFDDARELFYYRTHGNFANLLAAKDLFPPAVLTTFPNDYIDAYANGLLTGNGQDNDNPNAPWPGADSLEHYFTLHDFWRVPTPPFYYTNFIRRLATASSNLNTYDRYTFYRLLSQLGNDSAPEAPLATPDRLMAKLWANSPVDYPAEPVGKINLNYDNIGQSAAQMIEWTPERFFTNVANILLRAQYNFGITNIPISPTNWYTPAVHRLLQVAANLYDATQPSFNPADPKSYPSVFRPRFRVNGNNVVIAGYYYDNDEQTVRPWLTNNPYGVPMVIGAKKGLPNFNEYVLQTTALASRKLQLHRDDTNSPPSQTNEMYILGISNFCAVEFWNSYKATNTTPMQLEVGTLTEFTLTNYTGMLLRTNIGAGQILTFTGWPGFQQPNSPASYYSFQVPLSNYVVVLNNSAYRPGKTPPFDGLTNTFEKGDFIIPQWVLTISNRLTGVLSTQNRILDFVLLGNLTNTFDITAELMRGRPDLQQDQWQVAQCFNTNRTARGEPEGIRAQMNYCLNNILPQSTWNNYGYDTRRASGDEIRKEIEAFQAFVYPKVYTNGASTNTLTQAPFSPTLKFVSSVTWQANDPLVHYLPDHLKDLTNNSYVRLLAPTNSIPTSDNNLHRMNPRYKPWGGYPTGTQGTDPNECNLAVKDPAVFRSDDWNFPTNKFGSIGWVGRVHRGTPWQTVYLKSEIAPPLDWAKQFMDPFSHPTNDWRLLDIFTVAIHPNASRGQLSVNQTNLAAWSAVLSGVNVLTNLTPDPNNIASNLYDQLVVEPNSLPLRLIVEGINRTRAGMPGGTFRRMGELLIVPELTVNSPYLDKLAPGLPVYGLDDAAYERIPQQILSLLKLGDARFVIYAFGQSLKPADNSIVTGGPYIGICTNYQITGEVMTRSVLRIDGTASQPRPVLESFNLLPSE